MTVHPTADPDRDRLEVEELEADRRLHLPPLSEPAIPRPCKATTDAPAAPSPGGHYEERRQDRATARLPEGPGAVANFQHLSDRCDREALEHHLAQALVHLDRAADIALSSQAMSLAPAALAAEMHAAASRVKTIVRHAREGQVV